jgi:hypothetical protein
MALKVKTILTLKNFYCGMSCSKLQTAKFVVRTAVLVKIQDAPCRR